MGCYAAQACPLGFLSTKLWKPQNFPNHFLYGKGHLAKAILVDRHFSKCHTVGHIYKYHKDGTILMIDIQMDTFKNRHTERQKDKIGILVLTITKILYGTLQISFFDNSLGN